MRDPFLHFYFQILEPLSSRIKENKKGMLFNGNVIASNKGYYKPGFGLPVAKVLIAQG